MNVEREFNFSMMIEFPIQLLDNNKDLEIRIKYFNYRQKNINFVCYKHNKILGLAALFEKDGYLKIQYVSIDPEFKGLGISKKLTRMMWEYAKEQKKPLFNYGYSEEGIKFLKHTFLNVAKEFSDVVFVDKNEIYRNQE